MQRRNARTHFSAGPPARTRRENRRMRRLWGIKRSCSRTGTESRGSRLASKWSRATGCVLTVHGVGETLYALHEHKTVGTICVQPVGKPDEGIQLEPRRLSSYLFLLVLHEDVVEAQEEARVFCARQDVQMRDYVGGAPERLGVTCGRGREWNLPIFPVGTSGTTTCNALHRAPLNRPDFLNLRRVLMLRTSALNLHNVSHMKLRAWARVTKAHQNCGMSTFSSCAVVVVPPPLTAMNIMSDANICHTLSAFPQMAQ
jgi:hypothetical protein